MDIREHLQRIKELSTDTKWIFLAFLVIGILMTIIGDWVNIAILSSLLTHLGMAIQIAVIVSFLLEITEIQTFFEKRLNEILIKDDYLMSLDKDKLDKLILSSLKYYGIKKSIITNNSYDIEDFVDKIQGNVMSNIGEIYRKSFNQTIDYAILNNDEIRDELVIDSDKFKDLVRIKTTTRFHLIPASGQEGSYPYDFGYEVDLIDGLKPSNHTSFKLWIDGNEVVDINLEKCLKINQKTIIFEYSKDVQFSSKEDNSCTAFIKFEKVEYKFDLLGRIKSNMNLLTNGANIHFASRHELELDAEFYGIAEKWDYELNKTNNFISIDYNGWAFPENGYFIYWKNKDTGE